MTKKYLFVGMAVILGVSLSFFACDDSTEEATEPTAAEKAAAELAESANFKGKATVKGATITLTADVTLTAKADVAEGVTLEVPTGKTLETGIYTLTVGEGGTLSVTGTISVAGTLKVAGTVTADEDGEIEVTGTLTVDEDGEIEVAGEIRLESGSEGALNGTITIKDGGTSQDLNLGGNTLWGEDGEATGKYVFEAGSKAYINAASLSQKALIIGGADDSTALIQLTAGKFSNSKMEYTLFDNARSTLISTRWISADQSLTIEGGSALTVQGTLEFEDNTAELIIEAGGSITATAAGTFKATPTAANGAGVILGVYATGALTTPTGFTSNNATAPAAVVLTTATAGTNGSLTAYVIGNASFAVNNATTAAATTAVTSTNASTAAAGTITAGTGTTIILTGASS
jgi:hypothetical protein